MKRKFTWTADAQLTENVSPAMDRKETLFTFGGEHEQFGLAALDQVDHLVLIVAGLNVSVSDKLNGAKRCLEVQQSA